MRYGYGRPLVRYVDREGSVLLTDGVRYVVLPPATGAEPPAEPATPTATLAEIRKAITPTLIATTLVTGAMIAIGAGLVGRYVFGGTRGGR